MTATYRYRQERYFAKPPATIWPFVSDTARLFELTGFAPFRFEERVDAQGRVHRYAHGKAGPFPVSWEEDFGEWQENRRLFHVREYRNGPMRRWEWGCELVAEGEGCRVILTGMAETPGLLGFVARHAGIMDVAFGKSMVAIERLIRESDSPAHVPGTSVENLVEPAARDRLDTLAAELASDPASHGLAPNLIDFLRHAPIVALRSIRPMALATLWSVPPDHAVELFLAAARNGIMAMGWDLLCPRCRGAKSRVRRLNELPKGAHCSSCNIDYDRNFSRNVELTFHPEPWVRSLPDGELCLLGPGTARHVKFQAEVAARSAKSFDLSLAPGPYRFRTVEAGAEADGDIGADGVIPRLTARGSDILLGAASGRNEFAIRNESDRPLAFVVENRNWAQDALTGERVIAMPAFRRLCPEQLLHPGDNAEIGWIAIMFTDLKGSTELYDALGDATAYNLVRDHFSFPVRPGAAPSWLRRQDRRRCRHGRVLPPRRRSSRGARDPGRCRKFQFRPQRKQEGDADRVEARTSCRTVRRGDHGRRPRLLRRDREYRGAARTSVWWRRGDRVGSRSERCRGGNGAGKSDVARRSGDVAWCQCAGSVC